MYRIELAPGEETVFRTLEELATAVHNGVVTPRARIYHTASQKWLPIEFHPHYKKALESPPPPKVPVPAPAPARRSRELVFVDPRAPEKPVAEQPSSARPTVRSPVTATTLEQLVKLPPAVRPTPGSPVTAKTLEQLKLPPAVRSPVLDLPRIEYPPAVTTEAEAETAQEPEPEPAPAPAPASAVALVLASQTHTAEVVAPVEQPDDPDAPAIELPIFERPKFHAPVFLPAAVESQHGEASSTVYAVLEPPAVPADEPEIERLPRPAWHPRPMRLALAGAALAVGAYVIVSAFAPERGHATSTVAERPAMPAAEPAAAPASAATVSPPAPRPAPAARAPVSGPPVGFSLAAPPLDAPRAAPASDSTGPALQSIDPAPAAMDLDLPSVPRGESLVKSTTAAKDSAAMKRILRAVSGGK